jgi:hypothetical protein
LKAVQTQVLKWLGLILCASLAGSVYAQKPGQASAPIRIDTTAARAVLEALGDPKLDQHTTLLIANLPGNVAMIRKVNELRAFGGFQEAKQSRDTFAAALLSAAHGGSEDTAFRFRRVRETRLIALALLDRIDQDPPQFEDWIKARVSSFLPPKVSGTATGYLIAGGLAEGFSFDGPEFYLDITRFGDDLGGTRVIVAHELYHAIQNMAQKGAPKDDAFDFDQTYYQSLPKGLQQSCYATQAILGSLLAEGTAVYVGDPALLPKDGSYSSKERLRRAAILGNVKMERTLLDMSLRAVTGPEPLSEDDVYAVGFLGAAPLYDLGYVMAKAIAEQEGPAQLGRLISRPGSAFAMDYIALSERPGSTLPKLGEQTLEWSQRTGCAHR